MNIGIDRISFYTSNYFVDLKTLAAARSVESDKYYVGIGQEMGVFGHHLVVDDQCFRAERDQRAIIFKIACAGVQRQPA